MNLNTDNDTNGASTQATASTPLPKDSCTTVSAPKGNSWGRRLSPFELDYFDREALKKDAGLSDKAIDARGYFSILNRPEGKRWLLMQGFTNKQSDIGHCIGVPVRDSKGEVLEYILLPRFVRFDNKGELIREVLVEQPIQPRIFNISPMSFEQDDYDAWTVVWTHSVLNADSAAARGMIGVSLHGKSPKPSLLQKTFVSETSNALGRGWGRFHIFVIDSAMTGPNDFFVTLGRLAPILLGLGELVSVVYLPSGPNDERTTLASYLAAGHTQSDLQNLMVPWAREAGDETSSFRESLF